MSRNGKSFSYLPTTAYLLNERKVQNVYIINTLPCSVDLALQRSLKLRNNSCISPGVFPLGQSPKKLIPKTEKIIEFAKRE